MRAVGDRRAAVQRAADVAGVDLRRRDVQVLAPGRCGVAGAEPHGAVVRQRVEFFHPDAEQVSEGAGVPAEADP